MRTATRRVDGFAGESDDVGEGTGEEGGGRDDEGDDGLAVRADTGRGRSVLGAARWKADARPAIRRAVGVEGVAIDVLVGLLPSESSEGALT
jgi:hypothetical protein